MSADRGLGAAYLQRLVQRDFAWIEASFHPETVFRALTPDSMCAASDARGAVAYLREWFDDKEHLKVLRQAIEEVPGGFWLSYAFLVREGGVLLTVEQRAYCREREEHIAGMDLVCSGFQSARRLDDLLGRPTSTAPETAATADASGEMTALPVPDAVLDAPGEGCATLTPLIRTRIRALECGQLLEVRTDDPSARENLEAWCRLSGNELVAASVDAASHGRFVIRKK